MKRISKIFAVAALIIATATISANAQIYYGVKAGANVSTVSAVDGLGDATSQYGYQVGATMGAKIPIIGIGVEAEAMWVNNKMAFANGLDINSNSIEIPVMASVPIFPMLPIYIKAGPSFVVYQQATTDILGKSIDLDPVKSTIGYTVGLGVKLLKVTLDVRFNGQFTGSHPFGDAFNIENVASTYGDIHTNTISATVGYRF